MPVPPDFASRLEAEPVVARVVGPETLWAEVMSGYCVGDPYRPYIERVALRWRRLSQVRFRAELTAFVRTPAYSRPGRAGEGPASVEVCAGVGYRLRSKLVLPQPIGRIDFFDGFYSPPRRMWSHPPFLFTPGRFLTG